MGRLALTGLLVAALLSPAYAADESGDAQLQQAKTAHRAAQEAAAARLTAAFDTAVKSTAATGDLDAVQALLKEKQQFEDAGTLPASAAMSDAVKVYRDDLQKADGVLVAAYKETIKRLTMKLEIDRATAVQKELQAFQANGTGPAPSTEAGHGPLRQAETEYEAGLKAASDELLAAFEEQIKSTAATGELDALTPLIEQRKAFQESGDPAAATDSRLRAAVARYNTQRKALENKLQAAHRTAISQLRREGETDEAARLEFELEQRFGRWFVLFRSSDASLWNTDTLKDGHVAVPLKDAPRDMKYLRIQSPGLRDSVIIDLTYDELAKRTVHGKVGWTGDPFDFKGAWRFGVFHKDLSADPRGAICVGWEGFTPWSGWGFGSRTNIDDIQGFAWRGVPQRGPLVFEIAVTSQPLTRAEQRQHLK